MYSEVGAITLEIAQNKLKLWFCISPNKQIVLIIFRYDTILKMETFSRDSQYLKQKLGLDIEVSFVRKGGRNGHIDQDRFGRFVFYLVC